MWAFKKLYHCSLKGWLLIKPPLTSSANQHLTHLGLASSVSHKNYCLDRKDSIKLIRFSTCTPAGFLPSIPEISTLHSEQWWFFEALLHLQGPLHPKPCHPLPFPTGSTLVQEEDVSKRLLQEVHGSRTLIDLFVAKHSFPSSHADIIVLSISHPLVCHTRRTRIWVEEGDSDSPLESFEFSTGVCTPKMCDEFPLGMEEHDLWLFSIQWHAAVPPAWNLVSTVCTGKKKQKTIWGKALRKCSKNATHTEAKMH